jgi:hypothetical protein
VALTDMEKSGTDESTDLGLGHGGGGLESQGPYGLLLMYGGCKLMYWVKEASAET